MKEEIESYLSSRDKEMMENPTKKEWANVVDNLPDLEVYEYLGIDNTTDSEKQKRKILQKEFLEAKKNGDRKYIDNFQLNYPGLENSQIDFGNEITKLEEFKQKVESSGESRALKDSYLIFIREATLALKSVEASQKGDDEKFTEYTKELYGKPNKEVFDMTLNEASQVVERFANDPREEVQEAYKRLKNNINWPEKKKIEQRKFEFDVNLEDLSTIGAKLAEYSALSATGGLTQVKEVYSGKKFVKNEKSAFLKDLSMIAEKTAANIALSLSNGSLSVKDLLYGEGATNIGKKSAFEIMVEKELKEREILKNDENIDGIGYKVVSGTSGFSYDKKSRILKIPDSSVRNWLGTSKTIAHEATHAERANRGRKTGVIPLELGIEHQQLEEGLTTLVEQEINGSRTIAGFAGYFKAGLAEGLDGKPRNFEEVFDILNDYYFLENIKKKSNIDLESARQKAEKSAYSNAVRTFRGIHDLKQKGLYFLKDIIYRDGSIKINRILSDVQKTLGKEKANVFYGAFRKARWDPTNPKHYHIIKELADLSDEQKQILDEVYNNILIKK